ncbi:hypothetical protein [Clostridium estertheticum]|nr:hypothetical protein [Clostridium estertheticum]MCB2358442.1 hypothetical protein [Clostridium estertheticum]
MEELNAILVAPIIVFCENYKKKYFKGKVQPPSLKPSNNYTTAKVIFDKV